MCDYQAKLVAWLDQELSQEGAAEVEAHLVDCSECRRRVAAYKEAGATLDAYCEAVMASDARSNPERWASVLRAPVWAGAAAAAAVVLLVFFFPFFRRTRVEPTPSPAHAAVAQPAASTAAVVQPARAVATTPVAVKAVKKVQQRHAVAASVAAGQSRDAEWMPYEPAIRIAIPADAMFPPGAVPDGINFVADVSLAADGSARRLRLQPQLVKFERRPNQP
ncbi:MAG: anti-sigma factor family protein [Steroidobacteraceae bacterium]